MLHLGRDGDDGAGSHLNGSLAPFLIPTTTCNANQHLHLLMVNVPIVAAARLEGDIHHTTADVSQITLADEILSVRILVALGPLGAQGITFVAEPSREFIHQLFRVAHIHGTLLVGGELWSNTFETAQGSYGDYFAVGSRELIASEDVTKEVGLQVIVVLWTEFIVERFSRELCLVLSAQFVGLLGIVPLSRTLPKPYSILPKHSANVEIPCRHRAARKPPSVR